MKNLIFKMHADDNAMNSNIRASKYTSIINILNSFSSILLSKFNVIAYTRNQYGMPNLIMKYSIYDKNIRFIILGIFY